MIRIGGIMAKGPAGISTLQEMLHVRLPLKAGRAQTGSKRKARLGSLASEQKLHLEEMDRLDREIPLPSEKTRGFVFRR